DVAPLGPLQVQAQLMRGTLSSQLWAERSATAELVSSELTHLRDRLQTAGLSVGELTCRQGTPPQGPNTTLEQRFVDEKA
ncbi:flagellar hook-length control protein FliK, partial [Leclercia adecarboxylata]